MTNQKRQSTRKQFSAKTLLAILLITTLIVFAGFASTTISPGSPVGTNSQNTASTSNSKNAQTNSQMAAPITSVATAIGGFVNFKSVSDYQNFALTNSGSSNGMYYSTASGATNALAMDSAKSSAIATPTVAPTTSDQAIGGSSNSNTGLDYSQTNIQVAGVDEADSTKNDGSYIYTITDNTVFIVDAYPGKDANVISKIALDNNPTNLLVQGNTLVVMGNQYNYGGYGWYPNSGESYAYVYDISDKTKPVLKDNLTFEGSYFDARLNNGYVYFVSVSYPDYRIPYPLPILYQNGVQSQIPVDHIFYQPNINYDYPELVQIHGINLADDSVQSTALTVESTQTMYVSQNNIYLSFTKYVNEYDIQQQVQQDTIHPYLNASDNDLIARINATDSDILAPYEKKSKIENVYSMRLAQLSESVQNNISDEVKIQTKSELAKYDYFEYTVLNKLSYKDGFVTPVASTQIPGSINNQFSFDESNGVLRIATTVHQHWSMFDYTDNTVDVASNVANSGIVASDSSSSASGSGSAGVSAKIAMMPPYRPPQAANESQNMVYTLDSNLHQLGSITGIAPGEQIYATRFDGDRLYLVTYNQVDPFFVIDLSDASNPTIMGQLKIPGFSRYLHPIGNDLVVGLGQDTNPQTGRQLGLKISLFNVSDVSKPKLVASYTGNDQYASSTALFDHHAFLLSMAKELLVIPVEYYSYDGVQKSYAGALVFHIDNTSIALRGLIDHTKGNNQLWNAQVERSLYINDELYTKSPNLLRINSIDTLQGIKDITLQTQSNPGMPVY